MNKRERRIRALIISNIIVLTISAMFIVNKMGELESENSRLKDRMEEKEAWTQELKRQLQKAEDEAETHIKLLSVIEPAENEIPLDLDNISLLARIIEAEARGEGFKGKLAVGNVIVNRIKADGFPDELQAVIYQPRQFQPVSNGAIYNTPSKQSVRASIEVIQGERVLPENVLFFFNPDLTNDNWIRTREPYGRIGNHIFSY